MGLARDAAAVPADRERAAAPAGRHAAAPAGLLLAAGGGSRLGGRPKALLDFHGEPLVRRGLRLLRRGGCDPVAVVVGAAAGEVRQLIPAGVEVVENPDWRSGMGGSLRAGLAGLQNAPAVVVALVDQPLVAPQAVRMLVAAWRGGATIAAAAYGPDVRTPVLFDAAVFDEAVRSASGDRGARALLRARAQWVQRVACDAVASPRDIDTADDLHALSKEPDPNPATTPEPAKEPRWS